MASNDHEMNNIKNKSKLSKDEIEKIKIRYDKPTSIFIHGSITNLDKKIEKEKTKKVSRNQQTQNLNTRLGEEILTAGGNSILFPEGYKIQVNENEDSNISTKSKKCTII